MDNEEWTFIETATKHDAINWPMIFEFWLLFGGALAIFVCCVWAISKLDGS